MFGGIFDNRDTDVGVIICAIVGAVLAVGFYIVVDVAVPHKSIPYQILCERGWFPYAMIFIFFTAMINLALKLFKLNAQYSSFGLNLLMTGETRNLRFAEAENILGRIKSINESMRESILVKRIKRALMRFISAGSSSEVGDIMKEQSEIDMGRMDVSFSAVKFFVWVIPVIGFLGTVWGISLSISSFADVISAANDFAVVKTELGKVTDHLGVVFQNTFLALLLSIMLMFSMSWVQKKEEHFLSEVEEFCLENLVNKIDWVSLSDSKDKKSDNAMTSILQEISNKLTQGNGAPGGMAADAGKTNDKLIEALQALPQAQDMKRMQTDLRMVMEGIRITMNDLRTTLDEINSNSK